MTKLKLLIILVDCDVIEAVKPKIKTEAPLSDDGEPVPLPVGKIGNKLSRRGRARRCCFNIFINLSM